mmetsp:Transcript_10732/g.25768  ORF Transcript_10732/g.25768 Transcript_10732/m.25768 type:complete len:439 (-) Transcript_10732:77-1393(-)
MSKPFDYSKWDKIELSDDEDDCHPNIDKESWFRMKHRSRVEREDNEEKDKVKIKAEMEQAEKRMKVLEHDLKKINLQRQDDDEDSDDEDDLDDREGLVAEIEELKKANQKRQSKLDEYEKNKKWNVDNMFEVAEERTVVNPGAGELTYTDTGFVKPKDEKPSSSSSSIAAKSKAAPEKKAAGTSKPAAKPAPTTKPTATESVAKKEPAGPAAPPQPPKAEMGVFETYHEFTEKYADVVEEFMAIPDLEGSKKFLLQNANIILQENCSNYLMLATLEDEMNGYRDKMKLVARQAQIVSNIAELAKTMKTHPGNVIMPFFQRMQERAHLEEFLRGVKDFQEKIIKRAVTKKAEMDAQREQEELEVTAGEGNRELSDIPREERMGPGGLDPLEVIETLPQSMVKAFESRDVEQLKQALMQMEPEEAQRHMDRCVASGLWVA